MKAKNGSAKLKRNGCISKANADETKSEFIDTQKSLNQTHVQRIGSGFVRHNSCSNRFDPMMA